MLKPILSVQKQVPTVACEACGKTDSIENMYNMFINFSAVPTEAGHLGFQCPGSSQLPDTNEHWACSIDCWRKVAHACIDEHMVPLMKQARQG